MPKNQTIYQVREKPKLSLSQLFYQFKWAVWAKIRVWIWGKDWRDKARIARKETPEGVALYNAVKNQPRNMFGKTSVTKRVREILKNDSTPSCN